MSPTRAAPFVPTSGFPRVSGDEPAHVGGVLGELEFSPRERG